MALFYRIEDIRGGGNRIMTLTRAKAIVARDLKISPVYVSLDPEGEYIRVDFAKPKPKRRARPARRRQPRQSSSVKFIGIEFQPR